MKVIDVRLVVDEKRYPDSVQSILHRIRNSRPEVLGVVELSDDGFGRLIADTEFAVTARRRTTMEGEEQVLEALRTGVVRDA